MRKSVVRLLIAWTVLVSASSVHVMGTYRPCEIYAATQLNAGSNFVPLHGN
jgi:hypothetical protein